MAAVNRVSNSPPPEAVLARTYASNGAERNVQFTHAFSGTAPVSPAHPHEKTNGRHSEGSNLTASATMLLAGDKVSPQYLTQALIEARNLHGSDLLLEIERIDRLAREVEVPDGTVARLLAAEALVTIAPVCEHEMASDLIGTLAGKLDDADPMHAKTSTSLAVEATRRVMAYRLVTRSGESDTPEDLELSVHGLSPGLADLVVTSAAYTLVMNRPCKTLTITFGPQGEHLEAQVAQSLEMIGDYVSTERWDDGMRLMRVDATSKSTENYTNVVQFRAWKLQTQLGMPGMVNYTLMAQKVRCLPGLDLRRRPEVDFPDLLIPAGDRFWTNLGTALGRCPKYSSPAMVNIDWMKLLTFVAGSGHDLSKYPGPRTLLNHAGHLLRQAEFLPGRTLVAAVGALKYLAMHPPSCQRWLSPIASRVSELIPPTPAEMKLSSGDIARMFEGIGHFQGFDYGEDDLCGGLGVGAMSATQFDRGACDLARRLGPYLREVHFDRPAHLAVIVGGTQFLPQEESEAVIQVFLDRGLFAHSSEWIFENGTLRDIVRHTRHLACFGRIAECLKDHIDHLLQTDFFRPGTFSELARTLRFHRGPFAEWLMQRLTHYIEKAPSSFEITEGQLLSSLSGLQGILSGSERNFASAVLAYKFSCDDLRRNINATQMTRAVQACGALPEDLADQLAVRLREHALRATGFDWRSVTLSIYAYANGATGKPAVELLKIIVDKAALGDVSDAQRHMTMIDVAAWCRSGCVRDDVFELVQKCAAKLQLEAMDRNSLVNGAPAIAWSHAVEARRVVVGQSTIELDLHYFKEAVADLLVQRAVEVLNESPTLESLEINPGSGRHRAGRLGKMRELVLRRLDELGVPKEAVQVIAVPGERVLVSRWFVNRALVSHLMSGGSEARLRDLEPKIIEHVGGLPPHDAIDFLAGKAEASGADDDACLIRALLNGKHDAAAWYCDLLEKLALPGDARNALLKPKSPILASLFGGPARRESAAVYLMHAVPLLDSPVDREEALLEPSDHGQPAVFGLMANGDDDLLELYAATLRAFGVSRSAICSALSSASGQVKVDNMPWIREFVTLLGLQDEPDIKRLLQRDPGLNKKNATINTPRLRERIDHPEALTKSDGGRLISGLGMRTSNILAIQRTTLDDTFAITLDIALEAIRKYERFGDKQELLIEALKKFNDPFTLLWRTGDGGYYYELDGSASDGKRRAELRIDGKVVSSLRVYDTQDRVLVSMRNLSQTSN
ncbi:MAG TPA: hypothetical protein VF169_24980 [Albitalea sp.]|uniref:hypothetical protein n=1 Tax=Piscinibacter sp. TaxID=1903157 RepID=UPI002ED42834